MRKKNLFFRKNFSFHKFSKLLDDAAEDITIQYGGSMNDGNAAELLSKVNVDGGLIGGASLKTDKFTAIVKAANA